MLVANDSELMAALLSDDPCSDETYMVEQSDVQRIVNDPNFVPLMTEDENLLTTEDGEFILFSSRIKTTSRYHHQKLRTWLGKRR